MKLGLSLGGGEDNTSSSNSDYYNGTTTTTPIQLDLLPNTPVLCPRVEEAEVDDEQGEVKALSSNYYYYYSSPLPNYTTTTTATTTTCTATAHDTMSLDFCIGIGISRNKTTTTTATTSSTDDIDDDDDQNNNNNNNNNNAAAAATTTSISISRKKLRLSKQQSAFLEDTFKQHNTLNPKQKSTLANQLNLRPRQVEVWFQNRRARTKLKQTEVDCEYLKRCCETLTQENTRLKKELQDLKRTTNNNTNTNTSFNNEYTSCSHHSHNVPFLH